MSDRVTSLADALRLAADEVEAAEKSEKEAVLAFGPGNFCSGSVIYCLSGVVVDAGSPKAALAALTKHVQHKRPKKGCFVCDRCRELGVTG